VNNNVGFLFFKQGFQGFFGLNGSVHTRVSGFGPSRHKVITKIFPFLINHAVRLDLLTLIVGIVIIEIALPAAPEIPMALRACISSSDLSFNFYGSLTKGTFHSPSP
jgi:hypothetical protein